MVESVLTGTVLRLAPLNNEHKGINDESTWRATVRTIEGDLSAIVKKIPENEIIVEIVCALLGRAIDLPIPRPLIVSDEKHGILFGSQDEGHPDLKHSLIPSEMIMGFLSLWAELPKACVFDEWIANEDRHDGNILTNGLEFWLIDHGLALNTAVFKSNSVIDNKLLNDAMKFADNDISKQKLINDIRAAIKIILPYLCDFSESNLKDPNEIEQFLKERLPKLTALIITNKIRGQNEIFTSQ